jgi:hypothetical protein
VNTAGTASKTARYRHASAIADHGQAASKDFSRLPEGHHNHRSGSCGRTLKHWSNASKFYPGARLFVFTIARIAIVRHYG